MLYIQKQCIILCVLLTISCILFGCGASEAETPAAEPEISTQPSVPETEPAEPTAAC